MLVVILYCGMFCVFFFNICLGCIVVCVLNFWLVDDN